MKIRIVRIDNNLIDISTHTETDEIPGDAEIKFRIIPRMGGIVFSSDNVVLMSSLTKELQDDWWQVQGDIASWIERQIQMGESNDKDRNDSGHH